MIRRKPALGLAASVSNHNKNQMNYSRTITFFCHLRNLKWTLFSILIGLIVTLFLYLIDLDLVIFIIFGLVFFLNLIPVVLIHINYYKKDIEKVVILNSSEGFITIQENKKATKIDTLNIDSIILTTGLERKGSSIWSGYYFYQIKLKDGNIFYLTSLLVNKKEFPFPFNLK